MGAKKPAATAKKKSAKAAAPKTVTPPPAPPEKNLGGRPELPFTDENYRQVESMVGYGLTVQQAADVVGLSKKTLERRLSERSAAQGFDALEHARAKVLANLGQSAYSQATGHERILEWMLDPATGKRVPKKVEWYPPNGKMTQFLLNVLGGFVPRKAIDLGNDDGKPFELIVRDFRSKKGD